MKNGLQNLKSHRGLAWAGFLVLISHVIAIAQTGIVGDGFTAGWSNANIQNFSNSVGGSFIGTYSSNNAGNRFWRFAKTNGPCTFGPQQLAPNPGGVDVTVTNFGPISQGMTVTNSGAWRVVDDISGGNWVFKTGGCFEDRFALFKIAGAVRTISTVTRSPAATLYPGQDLAVTANLSGTLSSGQGVYLRYTTNNYSSSTVVEMTGSGSTFSATIPGMAAATNLSYYLFTSGSGQTIAGSNADFMTINLNNNGGSNYNLTVASAWVTTAAGNYGTAATWAGGVVPVAGQPVSIGHDVTFAANQTIGSMTVTAGTVTVNNAVTLTVNTGSTIAVNGGALTLGAGSGIALNGSAAVTVGGGTLNINTSSITLGTGGLSLNSGTVNANAATINVPASGSFNRSGGTFNAGTSTLNFQGAGSIGGSTTTTFNNLTINTGEVTLSQTPTVNGVLQINGGNFNASGNVTYGSASTLRYNGVTYTPFREWLAENDGAAGTGLPQNVELASGAVVNLPTTTRALAGNLTICSTCSLNFNATGDLMLRGNWTNDHTGTNINFGSGNGRAVWFRGVSGASVITKAGSAAQTFAYLLLNNTNSVRLGSDVSIATTTADVLQFNAAGTLDLNGRTLTLSGNGGNILSNANATVNGGTGSNFTIAGNKARSGTGTLVFGGSVAVNVNSGATFTNNTGAGAISTGATNTFTFTGNVANGSTINVAGNLVRNGGTWSTTAPTYTATSTLTYQTSVTIGTEWTQTNAGAVGLGRPQNLVVNATLTFPGTRSLVGNVTLGASGALTATNGVTLGMTGDFTDNNTSTGNLNNIGIEITASVPRSMTKVGGAEFRPRSIISRGSNTLTLNNDVRLTGSNPREFGCSPGSMFLNNVTVTLDQSASLIGHATGAYSGTNGVINISANTTNSSNRAIFGNGITVNVSSGTFTTHANGLQVNGTAALNISGTGTLALAGAYVGNSPTYSGTGSLTYTNAITNANEWTATTYGAAGVGRPHNVTINAALTTSASERAVAGSVAFGTSGSIAMGTNPVIRLGGDFSEGRSSGSSVPSDVLLSFNNTSLATFTRLTGPISIGSLEILGSADVTNNFTTLLIANNLTLGSTAGFSAQSNLSFTGTGEIRATAASSGIATSSGGDVFFDGNTTIPSSNTNTVIIGGTRPVTVSSSRTLTIEDNINFSTTGARTINGTLRLRAGTITGSVNAAAGTVEINSAGAYTIPDGLFTGAAVGTLNINNGDVVTSNNQNLTINNGVTLTSGRLTIPAANSYTFGTSATWPTESTTQYITGRTIMTARSVGVGSLNFMGVNIASGTDNLGNVTIERTSGTAGRVTGNGNSGIDCSWLVDAASQPVSGRSVQFTWPSVWDNGRNMNNARVWRRISPTDPWVAMGGAANITASNPRVMTVNTTHFSDWSITDNSNPLPVTFVQVAAERTGTNTAVVKFHTALELNVSHYTLQRSADAKTWTNLTQTTSKGRGSHDYELLDEQSTASQDWYYRILSTDLDGTEDHSPMVVLRAEGSTAVKPILVRPNPMVGAVALELNGMLAGTAELTITAADGRRVHAQEVALYAGAQVLNLEAAVVDALPSGTYTVSLMQADGKVVHARVVK